MKLRDIAAAANVSLTTVSLVLNEKKGVGDAKRAEILRLLEQNGYTPRSSHGSSRQKSICFVRCIKHGHLVNGNPGFTTQILDAVEAECRRIGYALQVITLQSEPGVPCSIVPHLENDSIDGAIILGTELSPEEARPLVGLEKPIIMVDNLLPGLNLSCISMNNRDSLFDAMTHLHSLGHEKIGFLYSSLPSFNDTHRRRAFSFWLEQQGRTDRSELVYSVFPTLDGAYQSVRDLLLQGVRFPTALIANNDTIAIGAMKAFREAGLSIPEDLSIIGFDGLPFSAVSVPPLSTITVPCDSIGRLAVFSLLQMIRGKATTHVKCMVATELTLRGSTGPAKKPAPQHPYLF